LGLDLNIAHIIPTWAQYSRLGLNQNSNLGRNLATNQVHLVKMEGVSFFLHKIKLKNLYTYLILFVNGNIRRTREDGDCCCHRLCHDHHDGAIGGGACKTLKVKVKSMNSVKKN
jgi:hypothetical protein